MRINNNEQEERITEQMRIDNIEQEARMERDNNKQEAKNGKNKILKLKITSLILLIGSAIHLVLPLAIALWSV